MYKGKMGNKGRDLGNMSPQVDDCQAPKSEFSQDFMNKTTDYIERRNRYDTKEASTVKKQSYKGRYS
jgi:hypothetical protein